MTVPVLLTPERLRSRLVDDGPFTTLDVVTVTGSTNTDLVAAARRGAPDRSVLIAEEQRTGRGRLQRTWVSPRGFGLHISVLLRPPVKPSGVAWLPLLAGIALAETVERTTGLQVELKWPNDLLLGDGDEWFKAAGVLADAVTTPEGLAIVLGMGINVHHGQAELPESSPGGLPPTSIAAQGGEVDREELAVAVLTALAEVDDLWRRHAGDVIGSGLLDRYRRLCGTLGRWVRVELGESGDLHGVAVEIDPDGRLVVRGPEGDTPVAAGDVVHLRPA